MGIALSIIGTIVSTVGAIGQAQAQQNSLEYQAQVARNNAQIAADNARDATLRGRTAVKDQKIKGRQALGTVRAVTAAQGLVLDTSQTTPDDTYWDMMAAAETDISRIRHNATLETRRSLVEKTSFEASALNLDNEASSISPGLAGFTTFIGGMSGIAKQANWGVSSGTGGLLFASG